MQRAENFIVLSAQSPAGAMCGQIVLTKKEQQQEEKKKHFA